MPVKSKAKPQAAPVKAAQTKATTLKSTPAKTTAAHKPNVSAGTVSKAGAAVKTSKAHDRAPVAGVQAKHPAGGKAAPSKTIVSVAPTGKAPVSKASAAKTPAAKVHAAKPALAVTAKAAPLKGAPSPIPTTQKSTEAMHLAVVSAQKSDTVKAPQQARDPMAPSSLSKSTVSPAAAAKGATKAAPVKPAVVAAAAAVKPVAPKLAAGKAAVAPAATVQAPRPAAAHAMSAAVATPAAQRITAPAAAVMTPKDVALKAQQAAGAKKPVQARHGFKINELVVYPAHGVGRIVAIEEQEIAGMALELFVITFEKDKMTLRVPTGRSLNVMRKLAEESVVKRAMDTLKGKARIKRTMWSRRAQEFEQKINSGDLVYIAEVVRDLFRAETQPEQSYSERQLYEAALDRMAREIAAVEKIDERGAVQRVTEVLTKSAKSRRAEAGDVQAA